MVSVFKNFSEVTGNLDLPVILEHIRDGRYREKVTHLRRLLANDELAAYQKQKTTLPAFTPSGLFDGGRKMQFLKEYSGFIILDIDKLSAEALPEVKAASCLIPFTYACFVSPGGNGLKILVRTTSAANAHLQTFEAIRKLYEEKCNITIDPSGKDITRLCFFSWDPDLYFNSDAQQFTPVAESVSRQIESPIAEPVEATVKQSTTESPVADSVNRRIEATVKQSNIEAPTTTDIEKLIALVEQHAIDITSNYHDWLKVGFALAGAFGESGREYFHRLSCYYPGYNRHECDKKFDSCLKDNTSKTNISTIFYLASAHGIKINQTGAKPRPPLRGTVPNPKDRNRGVRNRGHEKKPAINKFHLVRDYLQEHFDIRYNSISTQFEFREKGKGSFQPMNENSIFIRMSLDGLTFSMNNLVAILKSDLIPHFNPFTDYFTKLPPWDTKTDHIKHLSSYIKVSGDVRERFDTQFRKWLIRAVRCALIDTYFNKQAFILVHEKQNSGKSTFCRFLCPPALSPYIAENLSIDKDSRILLTTNLLINLDELSTLSKFEINALKSLFSKDKINDRLPYDRKNSIIPRRASFIGSTNQAEFLNDESGSVRWLCFNITEINWNYISEVDINKVWAQAYHYFRNGEKCELTPEEIRENDDNNLQFRITTPEYELIEKYLLPANKEAHTNFFSSTDILLYLTELTDKKVKLNTNNIGKSLKMLGFTREKQYPQRTYGYYITKKQSTNA